MRLLCAVLVALSLCAQAGGPPWYRGSLHAHANHGAAQLPTTTPDTVVRWYREHGYQFASVTDLNAFTPAEGLKALFDAPGKFLVIPGEELSAEHVPPGEKIVDTIGVGLRGPASAPVTGPSVAAVLDAQARAIRAAGGLPMVAHPNLTWAVTAEELANTDRSAGPRFFELWNAEPGMNNSGGGGRPSTEQLWDEALSRGRLLYAVAVDDAHHFYEEGVAREANRPLANPGRAWVMVRAPELSWKALSAAMSRGDFYATTGVTLETYEVTAGALRITLSDATRDLGWSAQGANPQLYRTEFIGKEGKVLKVDESLQPNYTFTGDELYVRARITNSDGQRAWTQPVFARALPPAR